LRASIKLLGDAAEDVDTEVAFAVEEEDVAFAVVVEDITRITSLLGAMTCFALDRSKEWVGHFIS
jgi:hypothetical protein